MECKRLGLSDLRSLILEGRRWVLIERRRQKYQIIIIIIIIIISGKEVKIQQFMYRDATNVEPEMYGCTGKDWSHWNSNEKLKGKLGSCTGKTFDRVTTADSYTRNSTHNTESAAV